LPPIPGVLLVKLVEDALRTVSPPRRNAGQHHADLVVKRWRLELGPELDKVEERTTGSFLD
jgi:hypothetical protein